MSISTDPEYNLPPPEPNDPEYPSLVEATKVVKAIVAGDATDPTHGARYYPNRKHSTSEWFFKHLVNDPRYHSCAPTSAVRSSTLTLGYRG